MRRYSIANKDHTQTLMVRTEMPEGATYDYAKETIAAWEPRLLPDIGHMIFPNRTLPAAPGLLFFHTVGDSPHRRAKVAFNFKPGTSIVFLK